MNIGVESYVVRIYRREGEHPHTIVGMVEIVGNAESRAFRSAEELLTIIRTAKPSKHTKRFILTGRKGEDLYGDADI